MRHFVEEYLERNGVLRQQIRTSIDTNSTEGIIAAVEAGLGIGFVPRLALEKALKLGTVKTIQLDNGPIRRELSIALLNGPDPRGPVGQLLDILRAYRGANQQKFTKNHPSDEPRNVVALRNTPSEEHQGAFPE
jgi:DNA-binding transcriptional LysR family regulator